MGWPLRGPKNQDVIGGEGSVNIRVCHDTDSPNQERSPSEKQPSERTHIKPHHQLGHIHGDWEPPRPLLGTSEEKGGHRAFAFDLDIAT